MAVQLGRETQSPKAVMLETKNDLRFSSPSPNRFPSDWRLSSPSPQRFSTSSWQSLGTPIRDADDEAELQWAAVGRLQGNGGSPEKHLLVDVVEEARKLLEKMKERLKRVDLEFPNIEVQFKNLSVEASCEVVAGKPLPTLWNTTKTTFKGFARILGFKPQEANVSILKDVSGIIKPSRMTLLLGPPGCGKTTLLLALSGRLSQNHKIRGNITYNGFKLEEFVPEKTSAYINQYDVHIPQMTVKETLDFAARCQGSGNGEDIMKEVQRREVQAGIIPDLDINTSMKETSSMGQNQTLPTDHILKILGLESCANTLVGDAMIQGISGGQKRRLTTGEMIIGPARALFMDEISNGLDSSTTFQVISYIQQLVHITEVTALITLLQPAPETFELFDDIILMSEGKIIYHGLRCHVLDFFEDCGFKCPQRKGVADFLQEVISRKDQQQYWYRTDMAYNYVSADHFLERFKISHIGKKLNDELSKPCERSQSQQKALSFNTYSVPRWQLFKICMDREVLLMKRDAFIYVFKMIQLGITALITMTVFFRANMKVDRQHAEYYIGAMFYTIVRIAMNGIAELSFTVSRLAVFYRQRASHFFPAWAYSVPSSILKIPISFLEALLWTSLTYYVIGYTPEAERFFGQFMVLFVLHQESTALFRFLASISQTPIAAAFSANLVLLTLCLLSGFILPRAYFPAWLNWLFWVTPMTYSEIGIAINEFEAPRWKEISSQNMTLGEQVLRSHGLNFERYFYWLSLGAAFGFTILFNFGFIMAMTCLNPPETSRFIASNQQNHLHLEEENSSICTQACTTSLPQNTTQMQKGRMSLPFEPFTMTFQNVQYCVNTAQELRELGVAQKKLQLLCDITGAFRPGVLTALMGVTGAGKTTLMDVLSGRKTTGYIEGDVRVGGYTKVQEAFARVSGYCEQTDIHSPYITVKESVLFSAWLRLPPEIDQLTKTEFVEEVLQTIELDNIRDAIVGMPGFSGLSTEQRKRLTIAVELVSNPSVIFMDEPTTGLDARAAAIVMRAVKNTANTGRTVVCTIHQPSIDIFETFDELLLMKRGGQIIYSGPLGQHSSQLIEYFEGISGIPKIKDNYNPATWMLEVTSASVEEQLGVDFAHIYKNSDLYRRNHELIEQQKKPPLGSKKLQFLTDFPQGEWEQYKACLWKQHHSYWRNPSYNFTRFMFTIIVSIVNATVFCQRGKKIENAQDLFNIFSGTIITLIMLGLFNSTTVIPVVATERAVFYRERFAGMYTSWASSFAQVTIEIPYVILQAAALVCITYPSVGYYWSVYKVIWYFYSVTSTLAVSTYLGMFFMSLSPNVAVANILTAAYFTLLTLFAGFLIPRPEIPKWWIWAYWICPSAWTANGFLTSQYGDITKEILAYGQFKPLNAFLRDFYGFHANYLSIVAIILVFFPITLASLFAYFTKKSNFQRR